MEISLENQKLEAILTEFHQRETENLSILTRTLSSILSARLMELKKCQQEINDLRLQNSILKADLLRVKSRNMVQSDFPALLSILHQQLEIVTQHEESLQARSDLNEFFIKCDGFHYELSPNPNQLEEDALKQLNPCWFREIFIGNEFYTFVGTHPEMGPLVVSVMKEAFNYRVIVRRTQGDSRLLLPLGQMKSHDIANWKVSDFRAIQPYLGEADLTLASDPMLTKVLLEFEEKETAKRFKFGVLYAKSGQTKEEEMFSNATGSGDFEEFLLLLGDKVQLRGFSGFNGGLDTKDNLTGTHSVYSTFRGNEVMLHVSTMLPQSKSDSQQIEKKRHMGNDIVLIVFQEGKTPYHPLTVASTFIQIIVLVRPIKSSDAFSQRYKISICYRSGVPPFGPALPKDGLIEKSEIREWLLSKLINGETAAIRGPSFAAKIKAAREKALEFIVEANSKSKQQRQNKFFQQFQ